MLALSSSSTLSVTELNLMVVLPLPFPTPTTQKVHLKPALPPWRFLPLADLTVRPPPEPPDPPDPSELRAPPLKHDFSIILWRVSAPAQPYSTHLELASGDPTSFQPPPTAPPQPLLQGSITNWSLPPLIAPAVKSVTPTNFRVIRSGVDGSSVPISSSLCGSGLCLSEQRASRLPPPTRAVWYLEMCFQFVLMDLMSFVELHVSFSVLTLMKCSTGQRISSGFSTSFWIRYGNIGVRSISLSTASVPSSDTISSISLPQPASDMCLIVQKAVLFGCSSSHTICSRPPSQREDLRKYLTVLSSMGMAHNLAVESRLQLFPRVHIALFQRLIFHSWPQSLLLCCTTTSQSTSFFSVKSSHLGLCIFNVAYGSGTPHQKFLPVNILVSFGCINVDSDYFMLVVVTYSGTHQLLPTVLHWSSKTLVNFVIPCFSVLFYEVHQTVEDPSGYH